MRTIVEWLIGCTLSCALVASTFAQPSVAGDYRGDKESFVAFTAKHSLRDWPIPDEIAYYNPSGTEQALRYAHWTPKGTNRVGVVVHFNGRTEFIERNIYTYRDLLQRGFEVWAFDWRGQGFSKRQTSKKQRHSIDTFDTYLDDASYFIHNIVKIDRAQGKKVLLAHSMGGQVALRYLLDKRGQNHFDFAVLTSPLLRIHDDAWYVQAGNRVKNWIGLGDKCVHTTPEFWTSDFKPGISCSALNGERSICPVDTKGLTKYSNDFKKIAEINCMIESSQDSNGIENPDLRLACPTSKWLSAVFSSTDLVMAKARNLKTPTLMIRAEPDDAVDNAGQDDFCKLANLSIKCESIKEVGGVQTGHELLIEIEPIRQQFFMLFDKFIGIR